MIFNSLTFLIFLAIVYILYWKLNHRRQNILLFIASYVFYGWWDWRFLTIIFASSLLDYWIGLRISGTEDKFKRKCYLALTLVANLGLLGYFKYLNFFAQSAAELLESLGFHVSYTTLNIVLPVGISFYTFKTLSYNIDVYRRECPAHRDLLEFLTFISFFPELVAGPIMRATNLLNQFVVPRHFDLAKAKDGVRQMLWGFFQKIVIADTAAQYVNQAYGPLGPLNGGDMLLGAYFFAFQIYTDFAGYSNIASGVARLFGFELIRNFKYPYFSRSIAEFWQRWHISLSTWFRDYLYIPLGGNRVGFARNVGNVLLTFTVSGLWHGANWTFVIWGFLNGLYFLPGLVRRYLTKQQAKTVRSIPAASDIFSILVTFHLTLLAWIFFRSSSLTQVNEVLRSIFTDFDLPYFLRNALKLKVLILVMLACEWVQRHREHPLAIEHIPRGWRWAIYNVMLMAILLMGSFKYSPFIYFQF